MHKLQIKTLEKLIADALPKDRTAYAVFEKIYDHFADEEYLYEIEHCKILTMVYLQNFYKHKTTGALARELHLDTKTLLNYRKAYVRLFAKYYLNLPSPTETDYFLLYYTLKTTREPQSSEQISA